jgi:HTH-type transcriptional regulator/antitoxin HigA
MCGIKPIKNQTDYVEALATIEALWLTTQNCYKLDQLEVLGSLIDDYEQTLYPPELPDPIEALKFHIEQQDISLKDLDQIFASSEKTQAVLEKQIFLSVSDVWELCLIWKIPAESLIKPYELISN